VGSVDADKNVSRLSTHPKSTLLAALGAMVVAFVIWAAIRPANDSGSDLPLYEEHATIALSGQVPYRDFPLEYPPAALPMFLLPAVIFGDARDAHWSPPNAAGRRYHLAFDSLVLLLTAAMVACTWLSLGALRRGARAQATALAVVAASPLLIGNVFVERYDVWPAALTAAALAAGVRGRYRLAGAALGLGTAAKIYPVLLLPVMVIVAARHRGVREAVICAASAVGAAVLVFLPFAIVGWPETWATVHNQLSGGLQIETLASSLLVTTQHLANWLGISTAELTVQPEKHGLGRDVLQSSGIGATTQTLHVLLIVALGLLWFALARSKNDLREDLVRYSAATLALALVLGTVLSAQYITWLIPLVVLVGGRRGVIATLAFVVAAALTHAWFPSHFYGDYMTHFDVGATLLLLVRNLALLALAVVLVVPSRLVTGWWVRVEPSPPARHLPETRTSQRAS